MMGMKDTPRAMRFTVGIVGRRNVGKSSLLNALARQSVSIVSEVAGTTTDPVVKAMELLPLGPVSLVDTAGIDDLGALGELRRERTLDVLERIDMALLVVAGEWGEEETELFEQLASKDTPVVVVVNKIDEAPPLPSTLARLVELEKEACLVSARTGQGLNELREAILRAAPGDHFDSRGILAGLVAPGGLVVLVVPIDKEAPKGRLILPQVQTIRDALDTHAQCLVTRERELRHALNRLAVPPDLVVTDSQVFLKVASDTPAEVPLTSFSVLFSRYRGDLLTQVSGTCAIDDLRPEDRVLVAEACSHHPIGEDIGRVKIPRWLTQYVGGRLHFDTVQGGDFPRDLKAYRLVIHCGACTITRKEMACRIERCKNQKVPITNYGLAIAKSLGILERALSPFPDAQSWVQQQRRQRPG